MEFDIFLKNKNELTINEQVDILLKEYIDSKKLLEEKEKKLREAILNAMLENEIYKCDTGHFNLSLTNAKRIEIFDEDKFYENESQDLIVNFTNIKEEEVFNFNKFKDENPDVYNKYLNKKTELELDVKKLQKTLPAIYEKYVTYKDSDKKVSLRITEKK